MIDEFVLVIKDTRVYPVQAGGSQITFVFIRQNM